MCNFAQIFINYSFSMMRTSKQLLNYTLSVTLMSTVLTAAAPLAATFVDGVFVGNFLGAHAFNAINITLPITNVITVLTLICSMGGSVLAAKSLAFQDVAKARKIFTISAYSAFAVAALSVILIYVFMDKFAAFVCPDASSVGYFKDYLYVMLLYFLFVPLNSTLNNFVSQEGHPSLTTRIVIISNVVNISLDVVFMYLMGMGIEGAALATVVSGVLNTLAYIPHFARGNSHYKLVPLRKDDVGILQQSLIQGVAFNVFYIMINTLVFFSNKLMMDVLGGSGMQVYGVCLQIQSFTFCIAVGAAIAGIAQVNRLLGEALSEKVAYVITVLMRFTALFFLAQLAVMTLFPGTIATMFGLSDPAVVEGCRMPFFCFSVFYLCYTILSVYTTVSFQLMGHVGAKFFFIFGMGFVVYGFMHGFSLVSAEMLWWGFPVGGLMMLVLAFCFGYGLHRKNPSYTKFTLVDRMPKEIIMQYTLDQECKRLPEMMAELHTFTEVCELPESTFKGIELCCTEYCEHLQQSRMPYVARTIDVIFRQLPEGICMIIESAGAPNSVVIDKEKKNMLKQRASELTQNEIRQLILDGIPSTLAYRYMFGLNVTTMTWGR